MEFALSISENLYKILNWIESGKLLYDSAKERKREREKERKKERKRERDRERESEREKERENDDGL